MENNQCSRCGCEAFGKLKTYCLQCNQSNDSVGGFTEAVIPSWVMKHFSLIKEELEDIAEINLGMYQAGYERIVTFPKENEVQEIKASPAVRRVSLRRSPEITKRELETFGPFRKVKISQLSA